MSVNLKMRPAVGIVGTVGKPSVFGEAFNRSRLRTILGVILTSNTRLVDAPGNDLLPAANTGLPKDSVANVTQIVTLDESYFSDRLGQVSRKLTARSPVAHRCQAATTPQAAPTTREYVRGL